MKVMLENVPLSNGIHSVNEFKYIIDNVDSLLVHLDIPYAFTPGGMKSVLDYISLFKDRIVHIHWHDNHGMKDEHLAIGEGWIDHYKAVKALKDINYDGTITLEVLPVRMMLNVQHISLEPCSFEKCTHWDSAVVLDAHDVMRCIKTYNQPYL